MISVPTVPSTWYLVPVISVPKGMSVPKRVPILFRGLGSSTFGCPSFQPGTGTLSGTPHVNLVLVLGSGHAGTATGDLSTYGTGTGDLSTYRVRLPVISVPMKYQVQEFLLGRIGVPFAPRSQLTACHPVLRRYATPTNAPGLLVGACSTAKPRLPGIGGAYADAMIKMAAGPRSPAFPL